MPRVLSVVAPANGSGKTSLIVTVLRAWPGAFTAVKASTVYRDGRHCPRSNSGCACRRLTGEFTVITEPEVIAQPGTDTGKMVEAGAARTLWCLCRPGSHMAMWRAVTGEHLLPEERVLAEGTGILSVVQPEEMVLVVSAAPPRERWKESTRALAERASFIVVNHPEGAERAESERLAAELGTWTARPITIQDVSRPLREWTDGSMARIASAFAGAAPAGRLAR